MEVSFILVCLVLNIVLNRQHHWDKHRQCIAKQFPRTVLNFHWTSHLTLFYLFPTFRLCRRLLFFCQIFFIVSWYVIHYVRYHSKYNKLYVTRIPVYDWCLIAYSTTSIFVTTDFESPIIMSRWQKISY